MAPRSRAREVALQVLYEQEVNPARKGDELQRFIGGRIRDEELAAFALTLVLGVQRNLGELDQMLSERAEHWSLKRMAATDRNVLRLGLFEIVYSTTPDRVVVNEAVELAKRFGSKNSASFVNGILDKFISDEGPSAS